MSPSQVPSSASDPQPAASCEQPTENVAALNAGNTVTIVGAASRAAELLAAGSYPALAAGMQIDAYQLQKKLGEGGMGTVWVALHTKLDKLVALKVLPAQLARDANAISRFEREMVAIGKLEHPHIVRAMDAGEVGGAPFLVMEFADGKDLAALVKTRGPRKLLDAYVMIWQAALALGYIHRHGLVHRDVKPSNLLLTKQGKIKLLDLGMARLLSEISAGGLTAIGQVVGTPDYMAPEQWDNSHAVDGRADLYALGCTLFYLLTGRGPYGDEQHNSMSRKNRIGNACCA